MSDRATFFEAILLRVHARMRLRPPHPLGARDVDAWLARRDPALLAEAERETTRWLAILNRLSELAEALIAADLRRLAHWCYAWAFALDPTLTSDMIAQQQVRANLALSAMLHPTLATEVHEDRFDLFFQRLTMELAIAEQGGADLKRALPILRRLVEAVGLPASRAKLPRVAHAELLQALATLVWPYTLPRLELLGPITAFRLVLLDVPDAEVYPWLADSAGPWPWIWTSDMAALTSWIRRKTDHFGPLVREARDAITRLEQLAGPTDPDDEDRDRVLTRALHEALSELHVALQVARLTREEALVAAFLAALQGEPSEAHARRAGLLPGPDTAWLQAHNLPELLARIAGAHHHRGPTKALRAVEQLAGLKAART